MVSRSDLYQAGFDVATVLVNISCMGHMPGVSREQTRQGLPKSSGMLSTSTPHQVSVMDGEGVPNNFFTSRGHDVVCPSSERESIRKFLV